MFDPVLIDPALWAHMAEALVVVKAPAVPVTVSLAEVHRGDLRASATSSLLIRQRGLALTDRVPGLLHAWVREHSGPWWAYVAYTVPWDGAPQPLPHLCLVRSDAIRPRRTTDSIGS
ncbi:hypothetical protein [Crossiella sp. NPDC003009]